MNPDEILSRVTIPNPCSMDRDRMPGDERTRFCDSCGKHVHDVTAMNPGQAAALLEPDPGRGEICGRIFEGPDRDSLSPGSELQPNPLPKPWQFRIRTLMGLVAGLALVLGSARAWLIAASIKPRKPIPSRRQGAPGGAPTRHLRDQSCYHAGVHKARIAVPSARAAGKPVARGAVPASIHLGSSGSGSDTTGLLPPGGGSTFSV